MNYAAIYERLIYRARHRTIDRYVERHHVVPRCMGGSDDADNLVDLTAEEHFLAHALLVKIYPSHPRLIYALSMMCMNRNGRRQNNKLYAWHRRRHAEMARLDATGKTPSLETLAKRSAAMKGRKQKPESVAKRAAANRGKVRSRDVVERHRAMITGRKLPPRPLEWIERNAAANRGKKRSPETRAKLSAARRKRVISAETKARISASQMGRRHSAETLEKLRVAARNRVHKQRQAAC